MFCGLDEEDVQSLEKKQGKKGKKGNKRKKLITVKSGLVGMKRYLNAYNYVKYFFWYLSLF